MSGATDARSQIIGLEKMAHVWQDMPEVIAAWVFGSSRDRHVGPSSDVDIAVLFESLPPLAAQLALLAKLQSALQLVDIDVVVLNNANPILRFEAISGQPLFCRDLGRRAEFASLTARESEDEMAFWQRALG